MSIEISLLGTFGTLSVIFLVYILARLSERLGSVQKMPSSYRYYYLALFFLAISYIIQVFMARVSFTPENFPNWLSSPWFLLLGHHLPLTIGVSIGLVITWRYWSWLTIKDK